MGALTLHDPDLVARILLRRRRRNAIRTAMPMHKQRAPISPPITGPIRVLQVRECFVATPGAATAGLVVDAPEGSAWVRLESLDAVCEAKVDVI